MYYRLQSPFVGAFVDNGSAGVPRRPKTDKVKRVVAAKSVSCVELHDREVDCTMGAAEARASADPVLPSMGMAKTHAKTVSAEGEVDPQPV